MSTLKDKLYIFKKCLRVFNHFDILRVSFKCIRVLSLLDNYSRLRGLLTIDWSRYKITFTFLYCVFISVHFKIRDKKSKSILSQEEIDDLLMGVSGD